MARLQRRPQDNRADRVIPPHLEKFVEIPADVRNKHPEVSDDIFVVSIEFTDAAGNRWERNARGSLEAL